MNKRKPVGVTFADVRRVALSLPNVEEGTSYGTPAFKTKGKLFVRERPDLESIVVRTSAEERDEMMAADPETYFITDHYLNYPWVLARLSKVHPDVLHDLLEGARRHAASPK